jgi:mannitol 2-dehydrogenase
MQPLSRSTLDALPAGVLAPAYDRRRVVAGIAHIGVGAFHRAHLAVFMDRCLSDADQRDWGLLGINLLPCDAALVAALRAQDTLYTVTECRADGQRTCRAVGSMVEHVFAPDDPAGLLARLVDPRIRVLTLTITEGGYLLDERGQLRLDDEGLRHDLLAPERPRTAFGFVVGALARRRASGTAPFSVLSCDNLRGNGNQARRAFTAFARARSPELADWIESEVSFPNSMVDRITPAMTPERRAALNAGSGVDDRAPVVCEDFIQWVIEDRFVSGRPAWERHGVQMVGDVHPYEDAKIRLLNGAHLMLAYPAFLAGHRKVDEAVRDPLFASYLRRFLDEDAGVGLASLPGMEMSRYQAELLGRFANSAIADRLDRLCLDGGSKIPAFLGTTLEQALDQGRDARRLAFLLACFDRYVRVCRDDLGDTFAISEPNAMHLIQPIIESASPTTLLETAALVGAAARNARFARQYHAFVSELADVGVRRTLAAIDSIAASAS